jgi:tRNA (uracil-5-)-methyltransferase TRM9
VNPTTISRLLELNRQFYQTFALPFSSTRLRLQPGVRRILDSISPSANILDLGCGNGEFARQLSERQHKGTCTGLDFSSTLLEQVGQGMQSNFQFFQADLSSGEWDAPLVGKKYDLIVTFAVLHHLPGDELRLQVLHKVRALLSPAGRFIHSEWQFLNSARLKGRIQPWESIDLSASDVDPGDYLLDWRQGGTGLRYVHHFSEAELVQMAGEAGFEIVESFLSDGENSRLGLYQVWQIP